MKGTLHQLQKDLAQCERYLHYAKACRELLETDAWRCIEDRLAAERHAAAERLVSAKFANAQDLGIVQGGIRMLDLLMGIPRLNADQVADLEKKVTRLRARLDERKRLDIDRDLPGMAEQVADIKRIFHQGATQ